MPNPNYLPRATYAPVQRKDPQAERLQQLAALAQIYSGINGPDQRAQENSQSQTIQALGLLMQQQHQNAQLDLQGQGQKGEQDYRDALIQNAKAAQANEATKIGNEQLWHQQEIANQQQLGTRQIHAGFLKDMMTDPSIPLDQKMAGVSTLDPSLLPAVQAMHQAGITSKVNATAPGFAAAYQANQNDPVKLAKALGALKMTMPQEVFNNQDWTGLNQSLPSGNIKSQQGANVPDFSQYPDLQKAYQNEMDQQQKETAAQAIQQQQQAELQKRQAAELYLRQQQFKRTGPNMDQGSWALGAF